MFTECPRYSYSSRHLEALLGSKSALDAKTLAVSASLLVTSGRSLYEVQKIPAHSDPKITMRYAHLSAKTLQEAANAASVLMPQVATAV